MQNSALADDYLTRAGHRLAAIEVLLQRESFADVVRESQEVVELCLKAVLRKAGIDAPRLHDVSGVLIAERSRLPDALEVNVDRLAKISRGVRRDRELAFYGSEDLTPTEFYQREDAEQALADARWVHGVCSG